jgi:hypothetical protein
MNMALPLTAASAVARVGRTAGFPYEPYVVRLQTTWRGRCSSRRPAAGPAAARGPAWRRPQRALQRARPRPRTLPRSPSDVGHKAICCEPARDCGGGLACATLPACGCHELCQASAWRASSYISVSETWPAIYCHVGTGCGSGGLALLPRMNLYISVLGGKACNVQLCWCRVRVGGRGVAAADAHGAADAGGAASG